MTNEIKMTEVKEEIHIDVRLIPKHAQESIARETLAFIKRAVPQKQKTKNTRDEKE